MRYPEKIPSALLQPVAEFERTHTLKETVEWLVREHGIVCAKTTVWKRLQKFRNCIPQMPPPIPLLSEAVCNQIADRVVTKLLVVFNRQNTKDSKVKKLKAEAKSLEMMLRSYELLHHVNHPHR